MADAGTLKVCVAGAGAIGCTVAARLAMAGISVNVLARGPALSAIAQNGIALTDLDGEHRVSVSASNQAGEFGVQDIIFVCTKAQALGRILPDLSPMIGPDTVLIPMVNGVPWWYFHGDGGRFEGRRVQVLDPNGEMEQAVPFKHIVGCVVFITSEVMAPGVVKSSTPHLLIFGEPNNTYSERLERIKTLFDASGIEARATDQIRDPLWAKMIANLTSNPLSVVTRAPLQAIYTEPGLKRIAIKMLHEGLAVSAAYGARIQYDPHTFMELAAGMGDVRTSMLQDFDKGIALELAAIGDAFMELAQLMGMEMPVTCDIVSMARFLGQQREREMVKA
ncbi:MAG TPA: 2-dehydropantoate 2-reductase [Pusillimonas sp.]|jgi:2-dehydropantoate 2-reductase|nr:2-dehydropantoate 2-reductase [Pusillimonas sp.]HCN71088.1 2-dehydropantoate 2-reductase [Pusillimonas sp.]|tara:strand:+ start:171093 stop:172097 length:1005 start_codon:yes stop_codon:yes gene_type:complete